MKALLRAVLPIETAKRRLAPYPDALLRAQAVWNRRRVTRGTRLSVPARGAAALERYATLGVGPGEVEVELLLSTLNTGTEYARLHWLPGARADFPYVPAGSAVGRVRHLGRDVRAFKVGDLVAGFLVQASRQSVPGDALIRVPGGLDLETAALLHSANTAIQGLRMGGFRSGERVVVLGQGLIGRLAALLARAEGAAEVIPVTRSAARLERFREKHGLALADPAAEERLEELAAPLVIDATGDPEAIHAALAAAAPGGRVVLLGSNRGHTAELDLDGAALAKQLSIVGAHVSNQRALPSRLGSDFGGEAQKIARLEAQGRLRLADAITLRLAARDLADYYEDGFGADPEACAIQVDWRGIDAYAPPSSEPLVAAPGARLAPDVAPLRMAVIGCGDIGLRDARGVAACRGFELAAVCDARPALARDIGEQLGVPHTSDLDALLSDSSLDAVLLAVPPFAHADLVRRALAAGLHVLVEKPIALSLDDARQMVDAARRAKRLLRTFYPERYEGAYRLARALVDRRALGRLIGVQLVVQLDRAQAYWHGGFRGRAPSDWRTRKDLAGGGFLIGNLVHVLDDLEYATGVRIREITGYCDALYHPVEVEDTVGLAFRGAGGEIGTISASNAVRGVGDEWIRVWGENGQLVIERDAVRFYSHRRIGAYDRLCWHRVAAPRRAAEADFLDDMRQQIADGFETDPDEAGLRTLAVVMAAYRAQQQRRAVPVGEMHGSDPGSEGRAGRMPAPPRVARDAVMERA